ncbi:flagellar biosynthetic protein FliO [Castellaniella sp.]|uniref:flagellar biosynthetic protein FliO n=1 Tax=Castellaniella sp. TaxID=1955812 RepID=UPI003A8F96D5
MSQGQILQVLGALLFVLALLLAFAWFARRGGWIRNASKTINLRVLGSQSLGSRCAITVVQIDNTRLVLGVTPQHISVLHTLPGPSNPQPGPNDFSQMLDKTIAGS